MNRSDNSSTARDQRVTLWWRLATAATRGFGHLVGTATLAVVLAVPLVSTQTLELYLGAWRDPAFTPAWEGLLLHVGLAACVWGLLVAGVRLVGRRYHESKRSKQLVRARRGSVMVETLIVIVPFLLLTSGLAQLALRNVAGLLADLALYQGTRAAWIWQPEHDRSRGSTGGDIGEEEICQRVRLASAAVLAPSAPSSFEFRDDSPQAVSDLRATMYATFRDRADPGAGGQAMTRANQAVQGGDAAEGENLSFARAFDDSSLRRRAARKLTFAYLALENYAIHYHGSQVFVTFVYNFNVVFPWFAQIFGGDYDQNGPSGNSVRPGWYVEIQRHRPGRTRLYNLQQQAGVDPDLSESWQCDGP